MNLFFIRETALARLYRHKDGSEQWVPRSVCSKTLKWPPEHGQPPMHQVEIETWWLEKNPWPTPNPQKALL